MQKARPEWEIDPGLGLGPLRFGMTRQECRELLGTHFQILSEAQDLFDDGEFELEYDALGRLQFISVGAFADRIPTLGGVRLLGRRRDHVMGDMDALTHVHGIVHDELSVLYRTLQMEIYQCYGGGNEFSAVNLGRPGYFD